MMRKMRGIVLILLCVALLCACSAELPELSEEELEKVSQYAATVLLKHDSNYNDGIMSEEDMAKYMRRTIIPTAVPTEPPKKEDSQGEGTGDGSLVTPAEVVDNRTFTTFFNIPGVDIQYVSYALLDSYPDDASDDFYFAMDATPGNKLLVISFQVSNVSDQEKLVDILSLGLKARVSINGGKQEGTLATLLMDDLKTMQKSLAPGEAAKEVIVAEIPGEEADVISAGSIELKFILSGDSLSKKLD